MLVVGAALGAATGCRSAIGVGLLNLVGLSEKPLVLGVVTERLDAAQRSAELLNPIGPYNDAMNALGAATRRRVTPSVCFPFQTQPNLDVGLYHLAVLTPCQFARLTDPTKVEVMATAIDLQGRAARPALLIARDDSPIKACEDLRGKVVAFGPKNDSRTHTAALMLLDSHGLKPGDLSLEVLPVPGSLKHFPNANGVVKSVNNRSSAAGFVDIADWEALPETGSADAPGRSSFRIVAETVALPNHLILRSPTLDETTTEAARAFFLSVSEHNREAMRPIGVSGYEAPTPDVMETCLSLRAVVSADSPASLILPQ
ncbi:MAG: PhnD/SsuA/transferrin family substrate-binding protein [Phycisphaerales bacterium]|nr:PhnD/SsuA/transferrin family substrate-binding protein [Phycisphaerales bacterium]